MQLSVVMSQCPRVIFRIARNGFHAIRNAAGINHVCFIQPCVLALQFGDISERLSNRDRKLIAKPPHEGISHNTHKCSIPHRRQALCDIAKVNFAFVVCLMARFAKRYQIAGRITSRFARLNMMYVQLNRLFVRRMRLTALAGVVIALENVLPDIVFVIHFAKLIIFANRHRLTLQHSLQPLHIKLCGFYNNFRYRQDAHDALNTGNVLLNLYFDRWSKPSFVLAMHAVVESRRPISLGSVSP